jgi:hypothetical protein
VTHLNTGENLELSWAKELEWTMAPESVKVMVKELVPLMESTKATTWA